MEGKKKCLEDFTEQELKYLLGLLAEMVHAGLSGHCKGDPMFCLLVFNDPKVAQYISSCQRDDMIKALRESADRIEKHDTIER